MVDEIVLVVAFSFVERFQGDHLGDDPVPEEFGLIQLRNVAFGNALLFLVRIKDCRAILRAGIGALTIQFRRIMRYRKENFEQWAVSDLRRIVSNLPRFGMTGAAGAYRLVPSGVG